MAAPALARQKVGDALAATVGQSAPQVRAAHILLPTREAAEAARARVTEGGEDFATVARELSTDESTAANGGELGWFTREEMVAPFAEAAFALEPGSISEPVETEFGWHVIQVEERDPDRPLTDLPDQSSAAGGRRALARGAACQADRDLDAAADADPVRARLRTSRRSAAVACADTTPAPSDPGGNTGWDLYRRHAVRVALARAAESTMLS